MKTWLVLLALLPLMSFATQIQWYCTPGLLNQASDGSAMDSSYRFELGTFTAGFVPTADNLDQWSDNWIPVQRAVYNEANNWFTAVYQVPADSPIAKNTEMYMWGFSGDPANSEWVLCRKKNWKWPKSNPKKPTALTWNAADANVVVLGDVQNGAFQLQTVQVMDVLPPKTKWKQWAKNELGDKAADPDGDLNNNGIPDGIEFILGLESGPMDVKGLKIRVQGEGETRVTELVIERRKDRVARISIEMSPDLKSWYAADDLVSLSFDGLTQAVFRDEAGVTQLEGPWFWRYVMTPVE